MILLIESHDTTEQGINQLLKVDSKLTERKILKTLVSNQVPLFEEQNYFFL